MKIILGPVLSTSTLLANELDAIEGFNRGMTKWHKFAKFPFDVNRETVVTNCYGNLANVHAYPFGYNERDGSIARVVKPKKGKEDTLTTAGRRSFGVHIDHAALQFPFTQGAEKPKGPDALCLGGVSNPDRIGTLFAYPSSAPRALISERLPVLDWDRNHLPVGPLCRSIA